MANQTPTANAQLRAPDAVRDAERDHFDGRYAWEGHIEPDTPESFRPCITPEYERGGVPGGLVHLSVWNQLMAHGVAGRDLLDYASGAGHWGIRLAQEGARVRGFDFSPAGVDRSNRRARVAKVDAVFSCADASELPYDENAFDVVVGIGALHHTIKYKGTAAELHRVMRPGAVAIFAEVLEGNWFLRLARRWTMRHEEAAGDVILTEPMIREWAAGFGDVRVDRYKLLLMAKKFGLPYQVLAVLHAIDGALFRLAPFTRRWCGECVIMLRK
jgi:2-polyprenyl-3-methyl-5-hydroxy-6-metoxy-1,4-benzoquinol methylase